MKGQCGEPHATIRGFRLQLRAEGFHGAHVGAVMMGDLRDDAVARQPDWPLPCRAKRDIGSCSTGPYAA
jgi:hypothetical protein